MSPAAAGPGVTGDLGASPAVLAARGVSVQFGGLLALDDVDVVVPASSIVGLVGPNGAGKTTLFNVLSGLLRPSSGDVLLSGTSVIGESPQRRARRGLARTFQQAELFTELTVREHLVFAYRVRHRRFHLWSDLVGIGRRSGDEHERDRVDRLLGALELDPVADRIVAALPLGIGRLVEVGRALASDPSVVLFDEPSAGLDRHETERLGGALASARQSQGVAMLLVEHDVNFVLGISDAVHVLDFGRIIAAGAPDEIRRSPIVRDAYLGMSGR